MKRISIYTLGGIQSAAFRYRFYHIFQKINCHATYNKALSDKQYEKYMPISERNNLIKAYCFFVLYFRNLFFLCRDCFVLPHVVVISRSLLKRFMPHVYKIILLYLKKQGCIIIWDFDDDIIELKELRPKDLRFLSDISDHIVLASSYLKNIVDPRYYSKINIVPTTDGSMYPKFTETITSNRLDTYQKEVRLLWVGTSSGLQYLEQISPLIDKASKVLSKNEKKVILTVVCNRPLVYSFKNIVLNNLLWTADVAESEFFKSHIGLMPIDNSKYSIGKGGFKLIQYMSVGLPSLASSVGINKEILSHGGGYLLDSLSSEEWCNRLVVLGDNVELWKTLSQKALLTYSQSYNLESNLESWKKMVSCG